MKKNIIAILGFFIIISFATTVSAGDYAATSGGNLTVGAAGDTGGALIFDPSPSTGISASTDTDNYTIVAGSIKAGENAIEYGARSAENAMFQRAADLSADGAAVALTDSPTVLPGANWKDKTGTAAGS